MGFGDRLSKLFKGETETKSGAELTAGAGEEMSETKNAENFQTRKIGAVGEGYSPPQIRETAAEISASDTPPVTREKIFEVMSDIYDPEIPVDIVNLGLVYDISVEEGKVHVKMTLTSPGCPTAGEMVHEAQVLIEEIPGVKEASIEVVWDPPWDPSRMSEDARQALGF